MRNCAGPGCRWKNRPDHHAILRRLKLEQTLKAESPCTCTRYNRRDHDGDGERRPQLYFPYAFIPAERSPDKKRRISPRGRSRTRRILPRRGWTSIVGQTRYRTERRP